MQQSFSPFSSQVSPSCHLVLQTLYSNHPIDGKWEISHLNLCNELIKGNELKSHFKGHLVFLVSQTI